MRRARSRLVAVVSDLHFDLHCDRTWKAFRSWVRYARPDEIVVAGDFLDLGMLSDYAQGFHDPVDPVEQIRVFVREMNALLRSCKTLVVIEGNHDERWAKVLLGASPSRFKNARGLSLRDQCRAQGLNESVRWIREGTRKTGY